MGRSDYFSYFTIESNVLGVIVPLIAAIRDPRRQAIRAAATRFLLTTGVVYAVLLTKVDVMLTDRWINDVLHRILPIVMILDSILVP